MAKSSQIRLEVLETRMDTIEKRMESVEIAQNPRPTDTDSKIECLLAAAVDEAMDGLRKK